MYIWHTHTQIYSLVFWDQDQIKNDIQLRWGLQKLSSTRLLFDQIDSDLCQNADDIISNIVSELPEEIGFHVSSQGH